MVEEVGTDFRHPRSSPLRLSELFVYPDLQRLDLQKACSPKGIVRDRDVLGFIQEKKSVVISGAEKTGKTCLSKRLFSDLREAGYVPLLIRSDFRVQKSRPLADTNRIKQGLDAVVHRTYTAKSRTTFWQTKIEERALIVDDFHRLLLKRNGREELLRWADENFGLLVVITDPGLRMTEILTPSSGDTLLWTFEHVEILEFDSESRDALIRNWILAGTDPYEVSPDDVYKATVRYAQFFDGLIAEGVIPSLPLSVFMIMQQLETQTNVHRSTGLYGHLYEFIIRDVIREASQHPTDLEVWLNYLSYCAFELHTTGKRFLEEADFLSWHDGYCDTFLCKLDGTKTVDKLLSLGVFRKRGADVGFKYRYYYCFFLARYLASNIHEDRVMAEVKKLCHVLHNTDAANTMLFLCHFSKNPKILNLILDSIRSHFDDVEEHDLGRSLGVFSLQPASPTPLVLPPGNHDQEREKTLRSRDLVSRPCGLDEMDEEVEPSADDQLLSVLNDTASALHLIRIGGQVIRNFYGSMKGDTQVEVIRQCYDLCLRVMSVLYEVFEECKDDIARLIEEILRERHVGLDQEAIDKEVRKVLHFIEVAICYGLIKHTSNSLGLSALGTSFDKIISEGEVDISHRVLDVSARLDYFDGFPESKVLTLKSDLDPRSIGKEILRLLVFDHFRLFPSDYRIRQRVCDKLDIKPNQVVFLSTERKRLLGKGKGLYDDP